jgi:hypothetical protein
MNNDPSMAALASVDGFAALAAAHALRVSLGRNYRRLKTKRRLLQGKNDVGSGSRFR